MYYYIINLHYINSKCIYTYSLFEYIYIQYTYTLTGHFINVHLFNCLVTQIANQPITWQQLNAFRHVISSQVKSPLFI